MDLTCIHIWRSSGGKAVKNEPPDKMRRQLELILYVGADGSALSVEAVSTEQTAGNNRFIADIIDL